MEGDPALVVVVEAPAEGLRQRRGAQAGPGLSKVLLTETLQLLVAKVVPAPHAWGGGEQDIFLAPAARQRGAVRDGLDPAVVDAEGSKS